MSLQPRRCVRVAVRTPDRDTTDARCLHTSIVEVGAVADASLAGEVCAGYVLVDLVAVSYQELVLGEEGGACTEDCRAESWDRSVVYWPMRSRYCSSSWSISWERVADAVVGAMPEWPSSV